MTPGARRIPDVLLERYLTDALQPEAKARVEGLLADSPGDQARLAELRADSEAFLIQRPAGPMVARFQEASRARRWRWPMLLVPVLATAAAVVLVLLRPVEDPYFACKGPYFACNGPVLVLHRKTPSGSAPISPEEPLTAGDRIRFEVEASVSGFVAVVGKDSRGTITVYHPYGGTAAAPFDANQPELPGSIELDDTPGREDVYVLHSTRSFALEWAVQALREGRPLEQAAPQGVSVGYAFFMKRSLQK